MKKVLYESTVPVEISRKLRNLDYEKVTRQNVTSSFINSGGDMNTLAFQEYHRKLIEVTSEADLLRQKIYEEYVPEEYQGRGDCTWELDYSSGALKVVQNI